MNMSQQCPLFSITGQTVADLDMLLKALQSGGYTPLSLRELFRCRRGVKPYPKRACGIVLHDINEAQLWAILPLLESFSYPILLFCHMFYSAKLYMKLRQCTFFSVFSDTELLAAFPLYVFPKEVDRVTAVFSDRIDAAFLEGLRKSGVRMVLTEQKITWKEVPSGIDVLPVIALKVGQTPSVLLEDAFRHTSTLPAFFYLPLETQTAFSDPRLAIPLSILGANADDPKRIYAGIRWNAVYSAAEDRYTVTADCGGLSETPLVLTADPLTALRTHLEEGRYIRLRTGAFRIPRENGTSFIPGELLLYGYDRAYGSFAAMTALSPGTFARADLLPETLLSLCANAHLLTPNGKAQILSLSAFCSCLQTEEPSNGDVYYGWEAAVRYANWFYTRLSAKQEIFNASSVRTFFEERLLYGSLFQHYAETEDLYLEALESYREMLERDARAALRELRGKETLHAEILLFLLSDLMRKLLNAEEACRNAFFEEANRAEQRRAYLREKQDFRR